MYKPVPLDTSDVQIPKELAVCVEALAQNTHEVWAANRIRTGWVYGEKRDDAAKKHPNLVPYEELSEEEKELDRGTASEAIKALLKMGYRMTKA